MPTLSLAVPAPQRVECPVLRFAIETAVRMECTTEATLRELVWTPGEDGRLRWEWVESLVGIGVLEDLRWLGLSGNRNLSDLGPVAGCRALVHLDVSFTRVRHLGPLFDLDELQSLDLRGTRVRDLRPLAGKLTLRELRLSGCRALTDLSPLLRVPSLRRLELHDVPAVLGEGCNAAVLAELLSRGVRIEASGLPARALRPMTPVPRMRNRAFGFPGCGAVL